MVMPCRRFVMHQVCERDAEVTIADPSRFVTDGSQELDIDEIDDEATRRRNEPQ